MFFTLSSTNNSISDIALGNYISSSVLDPIRRVTGVGEADLFGTQYAMRIWLNPNQLESYNLDANDVIAAIRGAKRASPGGATRRSSVGEGPGNQHHPARPEHADHRQAI